MGRRILIIANKTLAGEKLHALVHERIAEEPLEFHVLVPQASPPAVYVDPATGLSDPATQSAHIENRAIARRGAEKRLASFRRLFEDLDTVMTGEVVFGDPVAAATRAMRASAYDEIIVSTFPAGISRWLKLDLPTRLERCFEVPVTAIVQQSS